MGRTGFLLPAPSAFYTTAANFGWLGPTVTNVGTDHAKFEKISISRAIQLGSLRPLVSAIRCEANRIDLRREERPIGSRAVKMLRDLRRRARGPARHVAATNARAEVRAYTHNWST